MFAFDDEFGLFDEDVIFNNEDILHEAPNDDNKKENKGQNGSGDNTDSTEDDAPTDYTDGSESPIQEKKNRIMMKNPVMIQKMIKLILILNLMILTQK